MTTAPAMRLTVVGCGDAFGSGGRLMTTYLVDTPDGPVLVDPGATVTVGLHRLQRNPDDIHHIVVSHLHGDHFAGIIWLLVQALFATRRTTPLTVYGPPGIEARVMATAELLFPRCTEAKRLFTLAFVEVHAGQPLQTGALRTTAFEVLHPSGAPSYALRFERGGRVLAFSGDTEWVESLVVCGREADVYIVECYRFEGHPPVHMSWQTLVPNLDRIGAKHYLLTHMASDMLARRHEVRDARVSFADDGLVIDV
jgi:ribonuclease BN (tRNA processing enzyme)